MMATTMGSAPRRLAAVKPTMIGRKKNIDELMASMKWKVLEASVTTLNWTSSARRPLRIPEAANIPTTGIIDPVMTPMREEKPSLTHPHRVVGRSTTSTSAVCSPAPTFGSWATTAS